MSRRRGGTVVIVARMTPRLNQRTRQLARNLSRKHRVVIVSETPHGRGASGRFHFDGCELFERRLVMSGRSLGHLAGAARVAQLNAFALRLALREQAQVVVGGDSIYSMAGLLLNSLGRARFVYDAHELMWALGASKGVTRLLSITERLALRHCSLWLAPSEARVRLTRERYGNSCPHVVIENWPIGMSRESGDEFRLRLKRITGSPNVPIVMFQGSVTAGRGLPELIAATERGGFHLVVQGDGPLLSTLKSAPHSSVTFIQPCSSDETVKWLSGADASFVHYENDGLNSAYACSSKFNSSVAAECPIVCSRLPAFEDFARMFGGVTFFGDLSPDNLNSIIVGLVSDPRQLERRRAEMRHAASRKVEDAVSANERVLAAFATLCESE